MQGSTAGTMSYDFIYDAAPRRVVFRRGALADLPEEVARIGRRALVLATAEQADLAERAAGALGERAAGIFAGAVMHVPAEVADEARRRAAALDADCCVAIGGGSTIGLAKAIALAHGLPTIAVPTTYPGSEMTPIWGITENGVKRTGRDLRVLPRTAIYDPDLTVGLPLALSAASGINAIAHAVEALYAEDGNPVVALMAEEAIRALAAGLPVIARRPDDLTARAEALYGAWLAGSCLGAVAMALHHKLCHTLGGSFGLPHAETHAVVLPYVAAFNTPAAPVAMARVARALGVADAAAGLQALAHALPTPRALTEIGFDPADIGRAADLAVTASYPNPRSFARDDIHELLQQAATGAPVMLMG